MSNQGATDKGQPPRVTLQQKRGRPIKVVLDQENQPVVDGLYYQVVPAKSHKFFPDHVERRLGRANNYKVHTDD